MLQNVFQSFLVTAQKPHAGLIVTIIAGLTNMSLDALFIVVFRWGVAGAALATGISQCIGGLLPLILFLGKNDSLLHLVPTRLEWRPFFLSCTNGMSELMGNISSSIVSMLYNFQLLNYAGENGIAAYGVLMYVQFIFIAVFFGYTIGVGPVIGYHYGAGNHAELKNLLRKSLKLNIITGISMTILANLFAGALSRIFVGYDPELYAMTKSAFHIFALSFLVCGINIFASAFFTALNNGLVSAVISFLRTLVFQVGSVLILPAFLGLTGIWLSNTFADLMAMLISIIFLAAMRKRYHYA
jgi:Na+-driven multidrug efflux pump